MALNIQTKQVIDCFNWDELVIETYGKPYNFQQQQGCQSRGIVNITIPDGGLEDWDYRNDTIPEVINGDEMGVSFSAWLARDVDEWNGAPSHDTPWTIALFWERNFYPDLQVVANDLHEKGLIPAGEYVINIDW